MAIVINGQTGIDAGHLPISNAGNTEVEGTLTAQGQNVTPFSGFKNYIINGNFDVWQRGTNFIGFGYGASDRFANSNGTDQQYKTIYENKIFLSSVTQSPYGGITTRIENGGFVLNNKTITLSFYFNGVSGDFNNSMVQFTVEGKPQIAVSIPNPNIPERKTITISLPNNTYVIGKYLEIRWWWTHTSTNTRVDIAQVQLEEGSVATPFENRPYGLELSLCQRYYERLRNDGTFIAVGVGGFNSVNTIKAHGKVNTKRVNPSVVVVGNYRIMGTSYQGSTISSLTIIASSNGAYAVDATTTVSFQANLPVCIESINNSNDSYIEFLAEL